MSVAESVRDRPALARATPVQPASGRAGTDGGAAHDGRLPLLLGGLIGLGPLSIDLYLPALPSIAHDLRAGDAAVALTLTGMLVGLAVGQLLVGPWSDVVGRRAPLIIGGAVHVAASLGCALAPSVALLDLARAVQGLGASAGAVLGMAVVRDLFQGSASARMLSRMVLVMSASPILAPSLGTALLGVLGWRSLFVTLAVLGVLITGATVWELPETLPVHHRVPARLGATVRVHTRLLGDRRFVGLVLVGGLSVAGPFAFVAGAPFVLQRQFGLSQQQFGLLFALSVAALIGGSQLNTWLLGRYRPLHLLVGAGISAALSALVMVALSVSGAAGLPGLLPPLWLMLCCAGLVMPNSASVVLDAYGEAAGTAAGILGAVRWGAAASVASLVGMLGNTALAMSVVCAGGLVAATVLLLAMTQPQRH